MNEPGYARAALATAGVLSTSMGVFHFWLPRLFDWAGGIASAPASLRWALLSLNAFWSLFAVITGVLALALARTGEWRTGAGRFVAVALAGYWLAHTAYLVLWPFPLPSRLAWLGGAFLGFAITQAALHAWPAVCSWRARRSRAAHDRVR